MEEKRNLRVKKLTTRQWLIYDFLKENCVGKENKKFGIEIISHIYDKNPDLPRDSYNIKTDIRKLRTCGLIERKIGSSPTGYWLMTTTEEDEGHDYIVNLTVSHLKTAISEGVPKAYFHQVLNRMNDNIVVNRQQKLKLSKYANTEVHRYSDDLYKKEITKSAEEKKA